MINNIEEKREQLNYELHHLLNVIEIIDGLKGDYLKYKDYEGPKLLPFITQPKYNDAMTNTVNLLDL